MVEVSKIIRIPKDLDEVKDKVLESVPGTLAVLADKNYDELGGSETWYGLTDEKWKKPLVLGGAGLLLSNAGDKRIAMFGKVLLASGIAEAIQRYLINKRFVKVKKLDNGLEVIGEGFNPNEEVKIIINGTQVSTATTDANGGFDVAINGTVEVKASTLVVVDSSGAYVTKIPYSITPSS